MPSRYVATIGGVEKKLQRGWSLKLTANGRNVLDARVVSEDGSYKPALDDEVILAEEFVIVSSSVANPTVLTMVEDHGVVDGQIIEVSGHTGSTPALSGQYVATRISDKTLSIPVNVSVGGSGGVLTRRIFGGNVHTPTERSGDGPGAGPAIETSIECADFNALTERRFVKEIFEAGTLKEILTILVANYLPTCTLHPDQVDGPTLTEQNFDWMLLRNVLDHLTVVSNGYVWNIDEYKQLRAELPTSVAAPFNATDDDVEGTPTITPSRNNYANRVVLRFSAAARPAVAYLIATANFADGATVTIDSKTYTFQTTLTNVDGNVKIGTSAKNSLLNLARAINKSTASSHGIGTNYANATTQHPTVAASQGTYFGSLVGMRVLAKTAGAAGNSITVAETSATAYWRTSVGVDTHLLDGIDQQLSNVTMEEDTSLQAPPTGIWEVVVDAPDILDIVVAEATAAAVLETKKIVPKEIKYPTQRVGVRPGQMQTINLTKYGLNGSFLLYDVGINHLEGNIALYNVSAVESSLLHSADRWRETYKQWSGTGGNQQVGAVSLSAVPGATAQAPVIISFGGSQTDWWPTTSGAWIDASGVRVMLNPLSLGTDEGTVYVRLRARNAGIGVTARLRNHTDGITVGTSALVTSQTFVLVSFAVTLSAGSKEYGIEISPSDSDEDIQMGSGYLEVDL